MKFKPYQILHTIYGDTEIISYPFEEGHLPGTQVMVRLVAGDPTTMRQVLVADLEGVIRALGVEDGVLGPRLTA